MISSMWYDNYLGDASGVLWSRMIIVIIVIRWQFYKIRSTVLCTMKSKSWERSSNTKSCLMVVELETLLALQARIMKHEYLDKFLSVELEANICLKSHTAAMMGFMSASPTENRESRSNSRENCQTRKMYIWFTSYKCFMLNTYSIFCVFDTNSCLLENMTFCVRITWRSLWRVLMEWICWWP
jgi:hypothetical protein